MTQVTGPQGERQYSCLQEQFGDFINKARGVIESATGMSDEMTRLYTVMTAALVSIMHGFTTFQAGSDAVSRRVSRLQDQLLTTMSDTQKTADEHARVVRLLGMNTENALLITGRIQADLNQSNTVLSELRASRDALKDELKQQRVLLDTLRFAASQASPLFAALTETGRAGAHGAGTTGAGTPSAGTTDAGTAAGVAMGATGATGATGAAGATTSKSRNGGSSSSSSSSVKSKLRVVMNDVTDPAREKVTALAADALAVLRSMEGKVVGTAATMQTAVREMRTDVLAAVQAAVQESMHPKYFNEKMREARCAMHAALHLEARELRQDFVLATISKAMHTEHRPPPHQDVSTPAPERQVAIRSADQTELLRVLQSEASCMRNKNMLEAVRTAAKSMSLLDGQGGERLPLDAEGFATGEGDTHTPTSIPAHMAAEAQEARERLRATVQAEARCLHAPGMQAAIMAAIRDGRGDAVSDMPGIPAVVLKDAHEAMRQEAHGTREAMRQEAKDTREAMRQEAKDTREAIKQAIEAVHNTIRDAVTRPCMPASSIAALVTQVQQIVMAGM